MRTRKKNSATLLTVAATAILPAVPAKAATMSASPDPPPVAGADIANFGPATSADKWFAGDAYGDPGSAKGQTFTTGNADVTLTAVTYQVASNANAAPTKTYTIRIGTVAGSKFTGIHSESATQDFAWNKGEYMTWTLDKPVRLSANTAYAVDVAMTKSTSSWETGIPYLDCTNNSYANGHRYTSGKSGVGDANLRVDGNRDRIFHIRLEDPSATPSKPATPPPAASAPAVTKSPPPASPSPPPGTLVTPFAVTATTWMTVDNHPDNLITGLGLSENSTAGTHDNEPYAKTMWFAGAGQGESGDAPVVADQELVFDLGRPYDLTHALIWNQNQASSNLHLQRGVKTLNILVSTDNKTFKPAGQTVTLAPAGGTAAERAQAIPLAAPGIRYVKFDIQSALSGEANEFVGLSEVRFMTPGSGRTLPPAAPDPPVVVANNMPATTTPTAPAKPPTPTVPVKPAPPPVAPPAPSTIPASFHAPSTTIKPSISVLSSSEVRRRFDEHELEFRIWRNVKIGKALKAAVIDVDADSGHMLLYLPDEKSFVLAIADYHDDDKLYLVDWLTWKTTLELIAAEKGQTSVVKALPAAPPEIAKALALRLRTDKKRGKVKAKDSQNTYPTEHEVTVQVVTSPAAPANIPKGELQLVAYVAHSLKNASLNGNVAVAAKDTDSSSLKEIAIPPKAVASFTPGKTKNQVFLFTTTTVKGKGSHKDGKKTLSYRWEHDQTLLGVRARLVIGGQLAAEAVYPSDLDRIVERQK